MKEAIVAYRNHCLSMHVEVKCSDGPRSKCECGNVWSSKNILLFHILMWYIIFGVTVFIKPRKTKCLPNKFHCVLCQIQAKLELTDIYLVRVR
jgi:hypothetical protein